MKRKVLNLLFFAVFLGAVGMAAEGKEQNLGTITVKVPKGWKVEEPTSMMRKAQYTLPREKGDKADAELVVFNFGAGQGGSVEANLERWYGQFKQPDGKETKKKAKVTKKKVGGMNVTIADVTGTYAAPKRVGDPSAGFYNEPNYRMLAAIVEAPDSAYFFKLVGPQKTVAKWAKSFDEFIGGVRKAR